MSVSRRALAVMAAIVLSLVAAGLFFMGEFCDFGESFSGGDPGYCLWWSVGGVVSAVFAIGAIALARGR